MIKLGKNICELRKSKNLTQEKLASELGVSIAAVSKWETEASIPDVIMLCNIADYFQVSVLWSSFFVTFVPDIFT